MDSSARRLLVLSAALLAACGGGSSGGGSTPPAPATYSISGTVAGASAVLVTLSGASGATATTDAGGNYAFSGLASGAYVVTPSKSGFTFTPPSAALNVTGVNLTQNFTAHPTHTISGTVSGTTGVLVTLSASSGSPATTVTDGAYAFGNLPDGAYTVTPSRTGFTFTPVQLQVTLSGADKPGQDFTAHPVVVGSRTIAGVVTGPIVQNVKVTLTGAASAATSTDATGHYTFQTLSDGAYVVTPSLLDGTGSYHVFTPPQRALTIAGIDPASQDFSAAPLVAFDAFSAARVSGARWTTGEYYALLDTQSALLGAAVDAPPASTSTSSVMTVNPALVSGRLTALQTVVQLTSDSLSGDAVARAGIDLVFQPAAYRVGTPDNQGHALYVRLALQDSPAGLVAVRQAFACTALDCGATQSVGTFAGSGWPGSGLTGIARNTPYTVSISFDTATSKFTYSLQGGAFATAVTATVDLSSVTSPPFTIDLSQANFYRARLFTQVRGGATGGAGSGGAVEARFDDVFVGVGGATPALFDNFNSGTTFDAGHWTVGGESVRTSSGALEAVLQQRDSPMASGLNVSRALATPAALQAQVTVLDWSLTGTGQVGARLAATIYNDGSAGLGPAPDVSGPSSQVGDLIAQISMTATDVSYAVIRCNVASCTGPVATGAGVTFVVPRTSLGSVTQGTAHRLLLHWDAATHQVVFQLDDLPPAVVDPTLVRPISGTPNRPFWQISNHAAAAGTGVDFATGSAATIRSHFQDVRKL